MSDIKTQLVKEKTEQIMRCYIPHITKEDSITGADLESVIFALIIENQQLRDKVESLEIKLNDVKTDLKHHKAWT